MVRSCWTSYLSGGDYDMYTVNYTLSGAPNLPELPLPSYVVTTINCCGQCSTCSSTSYGFGYQSTLLNAQANAKWGNNCNAPNPTPWQRINPGPYSLDVGATGGDVRGPSGSYFTMSMGHAIAVKFTPTSRFLPYIVFQDVVSMSSGKKTVIELRENNPVTNLPKGSPGQSSIDILARYLITIPIQQYVDAGGNWTSTVYRYNYAVPINGILAGTGFIPDTPYWIVIYSEDFVCTDAFIGGTYERVKFATSNTVDNNVAIWSQTPGACGTWQISTALKSISFATYKTDTATPAINVTNFGFAELIPTPTYVNTNCFGSRVAMQDKNVAIGIDFEVPRHYALVRFSIAYQRPDNRFKTFTYDLSDVALGTHEIFVDTGEKYMPGVYTNIAVSVTVIKV